MLKTRTYHNSFIEVISDEVTDTAYNKHQAVIMIENLQEVINDLQAFIDTSND
tara:strand:+ start:336 stop:494 length:159 start_codon:yes stop_codon:yes gene_type:complete